ncbi:C-reactive protein-like [Leucoraja erinacea]|uniref:C-reactive protein-like n=1 Tax=Leucoraja erinaceus TaxID=7782 RepID=UPI0024556FED|nr:C-reactive protein-like [Leucoraja erinacea]XP_055512083.1 C-reactive protein-like [Leucoraja erinacea]
MKPFVTIVLVMCIYLPGSDSIGMYGKSVHFPAKTANSFVRLHAPDFSSLTAFTVCLRAASEETRNYGLFSYATDSNPNELLLWQESKTHLRVELGNQKITFSLPEMNALLRHICVTWESHEGEITVWVNGRRSVRKVGGKGQVVKGLGQFILGQEQDSVGGGFDINQSFVGEITDVHMWDHVLQHNDIKKVSQGCLRYGGNIIDWGSTHYTFEGIVAIEDNKDCPL